MSMTVQQSNRAYSQSMDRRSTVSTASASTIKPKQPGILTRIGKAVGEILNGPQVVQKQNSVAGVDRFQMGKTNYQVSVQKNLESLTYKGTTQRTPLQHMDNQMLAWMNQEIIGSSPARPSNAVASRPAARRA